MDKSEIIARIEGLTVWRRRDERAPHKPLLVLYALGRVLNRDQRLIPFREVDPALKELLLEFGPPRKSHHPEYPFWRLQKDGIWQLTNAEKVEARQSNTDARKSELLKYDVAGGFSADVYTLLKADPQLCRDIALRLLNAHFPETIQEDILQAVGIDLSTSAIIRRRDPEFRERVLRAYEYRCAVCGFDVRIGHSPVALEAAHIKWHQAGGPDTETNGIALCTMHHKLFDRGAFTLQDHFRITVSERAHGSKGFEEWLMKYHSQTIRPPQRTTYAPIKLTLPGTSERSFRGRGDMRRSSAFSCRAPNLAFRSPITNNYSHSQFWAK